MTKLRVSGYSISIDGFGAGPDQSLDNPMGVGGMALHQWILGTPTFKREHQGHADHLTAGKPANQGVDDQFAARAMNNLGAWILGRHMFTHERGPWTDNAWKGWWGANPPYHCPVFVLTHHARPSLEMEGGTTFHFVTDGIHAALERAKVAANGKDIRVGGGAATIRAYLAARLIDELHLAIAPVFLGRGEHLFANLDLAALGYAVTERATTDLATHVVLTRSA